MLLMSRQNRGEHVTKIIYDLEREKSLAEKTAARDKQRRRDKLRKIDSEKVTEEIMKMLEQRK